MADQRQLDSSRDAVEGPVEQREGLDQPVLTLAQHEAAHADDQRPAHPERTLLGGRLGGRRRRVALGVDRGPQHAGRHAPAHLTRRSRSSELAHGHEHRSRAQHPAQQLAPARHGARPRDLRPSEKHQVGHVQVVLEPRTDHARRQRVPQLHELDPVPFDELAGEAAKGGQRPQDRRLRAQHGVVMPGIEVGRVAVGRGQHHHLGGIERLDQPPVVGLRPAHARREVVGDEEGSRYCSVAAGAGHGGAVEHVGHGGHCICIGPALAPPSPPHSPRAVGVPRARPSRTRSGRRPHSCRSRRRAAGRSAGGACSSRTGDRVCGCVGHARATGPPGAAGDRLRSR